MFTGSSDETGLLADVDFGIFQRPTVLPAGEGQNSSQTSACARLQL